MSKRASSLSVATSSPAKKLRTALQSSESSKFHPPRIAAAEAADAVHADNPLTKLLNVMKTGVSNPKKGDCVVYWMRMGDLRSNLTLLTIRASI